MEKLKLGFIPIYTDRTTNHGLAEMLGKEYPYSFGAAQDLLKAVTKVRKRSGFFTSDEQRLETATEFAKKVAVNLVREDYRVLGYNGRYYWALFCDFMSLVSNAFPNWQKEYEIINSIFIEPQLDRILIRAKDQQEITSNHLNNECHLSNYLEKMEQVKKAYSNFSKAIFTSSSDVQRIFFLEIQRISKMFECKFLNMTDSERRDSIDVTDFSRQKDLDPFDHYFIKPDHQRISYIEHHNAWTEDLMSMPELRITGVAAAMFGCLVESLEYGDNKHAYTILQDVYGLIPIPQKIIREQTRETPASSQPSDVENSLRHKLDARAGGPNMNSDNLLSVAKGNFNDFLDYLKSDDVLDIHVDIAEVVSNRLNVTIEPWHIFKSTYVPLFSFLVAHEVLVSFEQHEETNVYEELSGLSYSMVHDYLSGIEEGEDFLIGEQEYHEQFSMIFNKVLDDNEAYRRATVASIFQDALSINVPDMFISAFSKQLMNKHRMCSRVYREEA